MSSRRDRAIRWLIASLLLTAILVAPATAGATKGKLSIKGTAATEGADLSFKVSLSKKAKQKVSASFATAPGSASSDDFRAASGTVRIKKGKRKASIVVKTTQDSMIEPDETVEVRIFRPKHARIGTGHADGVIENDDVEEALTISLGSGGSANEGNPGGAGATQLQATLSKPVAHAVTADWSLTGGAQAADFVASSGTISFPPGQTSVNIPISFVGDYVEEPNETATFTLSNPANATIGIASGVVTVLDDDAGVGDLVITELMPNPNDVLDSDGEWLEVYNASSEPVNMAGLRIFTASTSRCTFSGALAPQALTLAAVNANPTTNGGLPNAITCVGPLILGNVSAVVEVGPPAPAPVIDGMSYSAVVAGASLNLDPDFWTATGNDSASNFCPGTSIYSTTDKGTPAALNTQCP